VVTMRSGERWSPWEMGIQTAVALPEDLASGDYKVAFSGLVRHDDCDLEALREFVRKGGYLVVTGNELSVLPRLVPEVVGCYSSEAWNQKPRGLCVDAELTKASAPLAKGLSEASRWCIPWHCPLLKVLDPSKVSVLVVSQFLKAREPQGDGVLAALIPYGKGYILCSAGTMSPLSEIWGIPDVDPKMHIPLVEGLVANFTVAGLRGTSIQSAANQALIDSKTVTVH